ncbi:MAG: response regulator [Christensenella sp.]|uniref:response regulator n=1 Tax=Christensenella sp. TaxID=1935934 RepID=UPI002B20A2F8|nr:response regulator [Christensenella sp.]MEA5004405.1 response regulator [Christensenella sp.]
MRKAIIVDQDPMVSFLIRGYLERDDVFYVAGEFHDAKSALTFLRDNTIDLMIMDFFVPDYDAAALKKALLSEDCRTNVILVTACRDASSLAEAMHLGAVDYLIKPFSYERLKQALGRYMDYAQTIDGLRSVDQETVDYLLHATQQPEAPVQKGVGGVEQKIMAYIEERPGRDFTVKELADRLGSSVVTVRRYLKRLQEAGRVIADIDYRTGGHPRIRYRLP